MASADRKRTPSNMDMSPEPTALNKKHKHEETLPEDTPIWAKTLIKKFDSFKIDIEHSVNRALDIADEANQKSDKLATEIKLVKRDLNETQNKLAAVTADNDFLKSKFENLEMHSRRDNLLFHGTRR